MVITLDNFIYNHLITLFYRSNNIKYDKLIIYENIYCKYHIDAAKNIVNRLNSKENQLIELEYLDEFIEYYKNKNCIVIINNSTNKYKSLYVILPEKLDKYDYLFLKECIEALTNSDELLINDKIIDNNVEKNKEVSLLINRLYI